MHVVIHERVEIEPLEKLEALIEHAYEDHGARTVDDGGEIGLEQVELVDDEECEYEKETNEIGERVVVQEQIEAVRGLFEREMPMKLQE